MKYSCFSIATIVVISIRFKDSLYTVNESSRAQPVLVLSNPSSTDITVAVQNEDMTATSMLSIVLLSKIICICFTLQLRDVHMC